MSNENLTILAKRPLRGLLALRALVNSLLRPDFEIFDTSNFQSLTLIFGFLY